jgi:hypothetical protein
MIREVYKEAPPIPLVAEEAGAELPPPRVDLRAEE